MTKYVNNSGYDLFAQVPDEPDVVVKAGETVDLPEADYGSSLVPVDATSSTSSTTSTTGPSAPASVPPAPPSPPVAPPTTEPAADAPASAQTQEKPNA